jgi:hypothetical protein
MDRVRQQLHRPAVWLIPLVVLAIQLGAVPGLVTAAVWTCTGFR